MKFYEYGDDWIIYPVEGYGNQDIVRSMIRNYKPDILFFITDPRFYIWLWEIENEIRSLVPMLYWHVWDNFPYPTFNKPLYESNDVIATISKVTSNIIRSVAPNVEEIYFPHSVDTNIFKKLDDTTIRNLRMENFSKNPNKFLFFWNSRNARRKQSGTIIWWFKKFLDEVGHDKAMLIMHTEPRDPNGQDLYAIIAELGLNKDNQVLISKNKMPPDQMTATYNMADCTLSASDAEGFGLCLSEKNYIGDDTGHFYSIKEAKIGNNILCSDGKYHKILNKAVRKDKCLTIKSVGNEKLELTSNHPVLCYAYPKSNEYEKSLMHNLYNKLEKTYEKDIKLDWIKAEDIKKGDFLVVPRFKRTKDIPNEIDILDYVELNQNYAFDKDLIWEKTKPSNSVRRKIKVNDEFLNLIGWYLAEGNCDDGRSIIFDLNQNEVEIAKNIQSSIKNIFNINSKIIEHFKRETSCRIIKSNKIVGQFLKSFCGSKCRNKHINPLLMNDPCRLGALINGLFSGDGNISKYFESYRLSNTSSHLIYQVRNILTSIGIYSSITKESNEKGFGNSKIYKLNVGVAHFKQFCEWSKLPAKELPQNRKKSCERRWIIKEDYILVPVRKIEPLSQEEIDVYDLQIEDISNFVSNGVVVHNSTFESLACETPIITTMTGGLQEQVKNMFGVDITQDMVISRNKECQRVMLYDHGIGIEPSSKAIIGSLDVPFIFEDRINEYDFISALKMMYNMPKEKRDELGKKGREYILKNYNFEEFGKKWDDLLTHIHQKYGSWDTRKLYKPWEMRTF